MGGWVRGRGAFFCSGALGCEMGARARTLKGFERIVTHTFACVCALADGCFVGKAGWLAAASECSAPLFKSACNPEGRLPAEDKGRDNSVHCAVSIVDPSLTSSLVVSLERKK
jgi:hypothetical protein